MSHIDAISSFHKREGEIFLILEDDMTDKYFPLLRFQDNIESICKRAPKDWEIILISWIFKGRFDNSFTEWNKEFDRGPHFHVAGTGAYLINTKTVNKCREIFPELTNKHVYKNIKKQHADGRKLIADVFIYSNFKTYIYQNRLFCAASEDSYINKKDIEWHKLSQSIALNQSCTYFTKKDLNNLK